MKAQRFFTGNDSYGKSVEVALSESGVWFSRVYENNGYGMAWSKWESYEGPDFEEYGKNRYSGERIKYDRPVALWGWNKMAEHETMPRVRLPN